MIAARQLTRVAARRATPFAAPRYAQRRGIAAVEAVKGSARSHLMAGIAGGIVTTVALFTYYSFSPAGKAVSAVSSTLTSANDKFESATKALQKGAPPNADEAIDAVKAFVYSYAAWIPGGKAYADKVFDDVKMIKEKHANEVNDLIQDVYKKMQQISKKGLSMESASAAADALGEFGEALGKLSTNVAGDILDKHPEAKKQLGGVMDQLKELGESGGKEAKKQVSEVLEAVGGVFAAGFSAENIAKAKKMAEDKLAEMQQMGDKAWSKALEEAKPFLDKNPKIKELLDKNKDALSGNFSDALAQAKKAAESGNLEDLQKYVTDQIGKAGKAAEDWSQGLLKQVPGLDEIMPKLKQLSEVADKHSEEGEKLLEETVEDIKKLLEDKAKKAQEIADGVKKDVNSASKKDKKEAK